MASLEQLCLLREARSWQVKVYHSAVARGHEELARSSSWVACVRLFANISICEAGPDPLGRREQAQRCRRNMPGQPKIPHDPAHPRMPRRSWELGLCSCDLQRNIGRHGRPSLAALDASGASGLATTVVRALREAGADSHAPGSWSPSPHARQGPPGEPLRRFGLPRVVASDSDPPGRLLGAA